MEMHQGLKAKPFFLWPFQGGIWLSSFSTRWWPIDPLVLSWVNYKPVKTIDMSSIYHGENGVMFTNFAIINQQPKSHKTIIFLSEMLHVWNLNLNICPTNGTHAGTVLKTISHMEHLGMVSKAFLSDSERSGGTTVERAPSFQPRTSCCCHPRGLFSTLELRWDDVWWQPVGQCRGYE